MADDRRYTGGDGHANDDGKIGLRSGQARKRHLEDVERLATPIEVDRSTSATKKKIGGRMQIVGRKIMSRKEMVLDLLPCHWLLPTKPSCPPNDRSELSTIA